MSKYSKLANIDFPNTPVEIAKQDSIRENIVRASAYITYCLKSDTKDHNIDADSELAALTTSTFRPIEDDLKPDKYLIRCINELDEAIEKIDNLDEKHTIYKCELKSLKRKVENIYRN